MTSGDILEVLEQLAKEKRYADPSDLVVLAELHDLFMKVEEWGDQNQCAKVVSTSALSLNILEAIILGESDNAEASLRRVMRTAASIGTLIGENDSSLPVPSFEGFTIEEESIVLVSGSLPESASEYVDEGMFADFLSRQVGVLETLEEAILGLDRNDQMGALEEILGLVHTLKGEVGLYGLHEVERLCHGLEDFLSKEQPEKFADGCLLAHDWLRRVFGSFTGEGVQAEPIDTILLRIWNRSPEVAESASSGDTVLEIASPSFETVHLNNNIELLHDFVAEAHEHLENADVHLLTLESDPENQESINAVFRAFHTIKGVAGFLNLPEVQTLSHESENILDQARKSELILSGPVIDLIFETVDRMRHLMDSVESALTSDGYLKPDPKLPPLLDRLERLARGEMPAPPSPEDLGPIPQAKPLGELVVEFNVASKEAVENALIAQSATPEIPDMGEILVSMLVLSQAQLDEALSIQSRQPERLLGEVLIELGFVNSEEIETALTKQCEKPKHKKLGELLVRSGEASAKEVAGVLRAQVKSPEGPTRTIRVAETVKVDSDRLDRLVDAVGELVIAKSIIARSLEDQSGVDESVRTHLGHLDKITRELQEIGMSLRMIPVRQTFQKMSRLVRDLSKKSGKQVEFIVSGEETELDKSIVDKIGDPLVHMVRNAVDHGLEANAEERKKAGKQASGKVELRAYHRGGNIYIDVTDDGRGLNREAILSKAVERGIVKEGDVLTDREVWNLIFEAGFSTAAKVTDVSGRGVGMDVVRRNVESLRGQIEVTSVKGQGTTISIRLPLTLAIIDGMVIRVGTERFILPTLSIVVSLRANPEQISTVIDKGLVLSHQGQIIPIYLLGHLFNIEDACDDPTEAIIIIVEDEGRRLGLVTDELLGKQQIVIKSLGSALGNIPGLAGGAIMPDGKVGLIVDISGLAKLTHVA